MARPSRGVPERRPAFHGVGLEQFPNPLVQRPPRHEPRLVQPPAGDDVVPLVPVLADRGEMDVEVRHVLLDLQGQLLLREVRRVQPDVVRPPILSAWATQWIMQSATSRSRLVVTSVLLL